MPNDQTEGVPGGGSSQVPKQEQGRSSARDVRIGIGLYVLWVILGGVFNTAIIIAIMAVTSPELVSALSPVVNSVVSFVPLAALIAIGVMARRRGRPGIAKGLLIGFLISIALVVLLAATCFGLGWFFTRH